MAGPCPGDLPLLTTGTSPTAFTHLQAANANILLRPASGRRGQVRWGWAWPCDTEPGSRAGLRRDATEVEKRLWWALRMNTGWKFRRQHPVGRRIVDFACPARRLAIELDGGQHADRQEADTARSAELAQHGYRVIRFWNSEVIENLEGVVQQILMALEGSEFPTSP